MKTEDKEMFFALYLNQQVGRVIGVGDYSTWLVCAENLNVIDYLELTRLSGITDDHAIELGFENSKDALLRFEIEGIYARDADGLRRLGYAVPFDGNPIEKLISMGWMEHRKTKTKVR